MARNTTSRRITLALRNTWKIFSESFYFSNFLNININDTLTFTINTQHVWSHNSLVWLSEQKMLSANSEQNWRAKYNLWCLWSHQAFKEWKRRITHWLSILCNSDIIVLSIRSADGFSISKLNFYLFTEDWK